MLLEAIEFFIANFKDHTNSPTVSAGIKEFRALHVVGKRPDTIEEYERYLPPFEERFGKCKISEITSNHLIE